VVKGCVEIGLTGSKAGLKHDQKKFKISYYLTLDDFKV